jgi:putative ABC transport system permease protein
MFGLELLSFMNDALYDGLPYGLVCLGLLWTAKYIRFPDLTCSGTFVLGGALTATAVVNWGWPAAPATALGVVGGAAGGLLTGVFHVGLRMDRILSGILSAFVLYSTNLLLLTPTLPYSAKSTLFSAAESIDRQVVTPSLAVSWHPLVILVLLAFVLVVKLLMDAFLASEMGLALRALEDEEAGESVLLRQGLSPDKYRFLALSLGNAVVGLAGALVSFKENAANAHRGFDVLVTGLIAFLVGMQIHKLFQSISRLGTLRSWPIANSLGVRFTTAAVLGALMYFGLMTLSQRVEIDSAYAKIFLALLVAVSVADPAILRRLQSARAHRSRAAETQSDVILTVDDLHFRYPMADKETLHGISFRVRAGEFVRLRGGNGSGKTTALRLLAGYLDAQNGTHIVWRGEDLTHDPQGRLRKIAYVDQNANRGVVGVLTTEENLALAASGAHPSPWRFALTAIRRDRLGRVVAEGGVPQRILNLPAGHLSGGQKQSINLLSILAREHLPELVFLDEPTNNLDANNRSTCRRIIETLRNRGVAVVWISHADLEGIPAETEIDMDQINTPKLGATVASF